MNAAYLLLTSAWMAGADPAQPAAPPPPAAAAPVVSTGSCCGGVSTCCDPCCDSGRSGFFSRWRERWGNRGNCCEQSCCQPTCCKPACPPPCPKVQCCKPVKCCPQPTCCNNSCNNDCCERQSLWSKMRDRWSRRGNDCCDNCGGCGGTGYNGGHYHGGVIGTAEPIPAQPKPAGEAPKKMPAAGTSASTIGISAIEIAPRNPF